MNWPALAYVVYSIHMKSGDIISAIQNTLKNYPAIELCILYGSGAADRLTENSDIDIAVASSKKIENDYCLELSLELTKLFDREVTVIDMDKMHGVILQEVLVKGRIVYCSNVYIRADHIIRMQEFTEDIYPFHVLAFNKQMEKYKNA